MNRQPNRNSPPDPRDYDMYAAFRTKERGEAARPQQQRGRYFDAYAQRAKQEQEAQRAARRANRAQNTAYPGGSVYGNLSTGPQRRDSQPQNANRNAQVRRVQNEAQTQRTRYEAPRTASARQPRAQEPPQYGARIQNTGGDAYRYGYHSSYRTSDGRIIDGFDDAGRPIYREEGAGGGSTAIIRRTAFTPDTVRRLHPVRRIRVETLADTDAKPFPFAIVFTVILCTALVMAVLYSFMQLNEYTNTLSVLSYRLSTLRAETNTLQAEVVRREDLLSIEQTASDVLGMVKVDVLTKKYVSIENEDKTEVVAHLEEEARKRVTVEIDLDTGKPLDPTEGNNTYIPPAQTQPAGTETAAPPEDTAAADTDIPAQTAGDHT